MSKHGRHIHNIVGVDMWASFFLTLVAHTTPSADNAQVEKV